ncbi:hypothetical protein DAI22_07g032450 [Oryza sativa Japonica Group]|nr:hypothetical protein DAI22_07g032450 [Oryza sativa Japonica Group]
MSLTLIVAHRRCSFSSALSPVPISPTHIASDVCLAGLSASAGTPMLALRHHRSNPRRHRSRSFPFSNSPDLGIFGLLSATEIEQINDGIAFYCCPKRFLINIFQFDQILAFVMPKGLYHAWCHHYHIFQVLDKN